MTLSGVAIILVGIAVIGWTLFGGLAGKLTKAAQ